MEQLGINPLWVLLFPAVVLVGYVLVVRQAHYAAKAAAKAAAAKKKADRLASAKGAAQALSDFNDQWYKTAWDKAKDESFKA